MKEKLRKAFKASSSRYGSYCMIVTAVVLAIVLAVNLVVKELPSSVMKYDLTSEKLYTVGDTTKELVNNLSEDITIYEIASEGSEDETITQLLENYESLSDHINVENVDLDKQPGFLKQQGIESSSLSGSTNLLVVSEKRNKVITYNDIYEVDQQSLYQAYQYGTQPSYNFDGEGEITSAISYVTTETLPKMYTLTGHDEVAFCDQVKKLIESNSIETEDLNLITAGSIPEDCDILALISPQKDLTKDEVDIIEKYIEAGGKCLIQNYVNKQADMPNYCDLLTYYGVTIPTDGYIFEANGYCASPYRWYLYEPLTSGHSIVSDLGEKSAIYTTFAQPILVNDSKRNTLTIDPIITTSEGSWLRTDLESTKYDEMIDSDVKGPFNIAVEITDATSKGTGTVIVVSAYDLIDQSILAAYTTMSNGTVFMNMVKSLGGSINASIYIPTKAADISYNTATMADFQFALAVFVITIPAAILIFGLVIWIRRRRR